MARDALDAGTDVWDQGFVGPLIRAFFCCAAEEMEALYRLSGIPSWEGDPLPLDGGGWRWLLLPARRTDLKLCSPCRSVGVSSPTIVSPDCRPLQFAIRNYFGTTSLVMTSSPKRLERFSKKRRLPEGEGRILL